MERRQYESLGYETCLMCVAEHTPCLPYPSSKLPGATEACLTPREPTAKVNPLAQPEHETCVMDCTPWWVPYPFSGLPGSTAACVTSREATARMKLSDDCGAVSRRLREGWVCNCRDEDWLPSAISCNSLSWTAHLHSSQGLLTIHARLCVWWLQHKSSVSDAECCASVSVDMRTICRQPSAAIAFISESAHFGSDGMGFVHDGPSRN